MAVPYRPLVLIHEVINAIGLEITYMYEDLVYIEHNAFLLQMGDSGEIVNIYFNTDSIIEERDAITARLQAEGRPRQLSMIRKGCFTMTQKPDGENIQIEFFDEI